MTRELPSLNAVRFFECAARHQSFTKAGAELCVTQGAVSRQIKLLEQQLECQLFARKGPYLALTSHGERFQETVTDALTTIKQGVVSLRRASVSTLTVSVLPRFCHLLVDAEAARIGKAATWFEFTAGLFLSEY